MSDVKGNIIKITNTITKTSSDLFKSTKLSLNLSSEEERLKAIYIEIGKKVHEIYQYGGSLGKAFDEKYAEIIKQEEKIQKLRQQLEVLKGTKSCPKCSRSMDKNAEFCSKCGYKIGVTDTIEPPESEDGQKLPLNDPPPASPVADDTSTVKLCRACGKESAPEDKFCLYCGRML